MKESIIVTTSVNTNVEYHGYCHVVGISTVRLNTIITKISSIILWRVAIHIHVVIFYQYSLIKQSVTALISLMICTNSS